MKPSKLINSASLFICRLCFVSLVCVTFTLLSSPHQAHAESIDLWVLRESIEKTFLCETGQSCVSPQVNINQSGALITWGASLGNCEGAYQAIGKWPQQPETLIPEQSISTLLEVELKQTTDCDAALYGDNSASLMVGKIIPPDTAGVGNWELIDSVEIKEHLLKGREFKNYKTANWTVPQGNTGEELHLRLGAGPGSLPGGYVVFIYDYQPGASSAKDDQPVVKTQLKQDECNIGLAQTSWRIWPNPLVVYARDSGARFADFSGEVTVAPGSDPNDQHPAEIEMVLETGSIIKTESNSTAIISFADMTTFCMKPFTTVILDTPAEKDSKLSLLAGKVWMNVKKMVQDGTMNVTMNQAVAGIKGTVLILEDDGDSSTIKVIEGDVEYISRTSGASTMVKQGESITANTGGLLSKTAFDIPAERDTWQEFTSSPTKIDYAMIGLWIALFAAVIGGSWVTTKRMRRKSNI